MDLYITSSWTSYQLCQSAFMICTQLKPSNLFHWGLLVRPKSLASTLSLNFAKRLFTYAWKKKLSSWFGFERLPYRPGWLLGTGVFICFYLEVDPVRTQVTFLYSRITLITSQMILGLGHENTDHPSCTSRVENAKWSLLWQFSFLSSISLPGP